jgi:hypothetical protein
MVDFVDTFPNMKIQFFTVVTRNSLMLLLLVELIVCLLSLITATPTQINIIGADSFGKVLEFLSLDELPQLCQVNKQFKKDCMPSSLKRLNYLLATPSWHSQDRISKNIEELMKWANESLTFTPSQQLWMVEAIFETHKTQISSGWFKKLCTMFQSKKESTEMTQTRQWLEIVKTKFELTKEMYHVCIRIIRNDKLDQIIKRIAAEFMIYMYQKGVPLP